MPHEINVNPPGAGGGENFFNSGKSVAGLPKLGDGTGVGTNPSAVAQIKNGLNTGATSNVGDGSAPTVTPTTPEATSATTPATTDATTPLNPTPQTALTPGAGQYNVNFQSPIATPEQLSNAASSSGGNGLDSFRSNLYNGNGDASIIKPEVVTPNQINVFDNSTSALNVSNIEPTPIANVKYGVNSNGDPTFLSLSPNGKIETTNADGINQTKFSASAIAPNPTLYNKPTPEATPAQGTGLDSQLASRPILTTPEATPAQGHNIVVSKSWYRFMVSFFCLKIILV